jgi:hypothetical protein
MEASCSRVTQRGGVSDPILLPLASAPACLACTSPVDPSIHPSWRRPGHHLASYVHTYWHIASRHRRESLDPIAVSDRHARLHRSPAAAAVAPRRATDVTGRFYVHERARAVMGFGLNLPVRPRQTAGGRPHRVRTSATVHGNMRMPAGAVQHVTSSVPVWCTPSISRNLFLDFSKIRYYVYGYVHLDFDKSKTTLITRSKYVISKTVCCT